MNLGKDFTYGLGRRKTANARVRLYKGSQESLVNNVPLEKYFAAAPFGLKKLRDLFELAKTQATHFITVKVEGSGAHAQLDAVVHGMARALVTAYPDMKKTLRDHGLLTRDARMKESRKVGKGGKARRSKQSPKR